jgi:hypothetical protein
MFCAPRLVFGGTKGVGSRFPVLCDRTRFRGYRGRQIPFSCFELPDSFSAVPRASLPVLTFCAPRLIFGGSAIFGSRFHVLRAQTRFQWYRGRWVPFSCLARPDSFSTVLRATGPVFMFFRSQTRFRWYRVCLVPFSCFACPDSFSAVPGRRVPFYCFARPDPFSALPGALGPVFMFCAPIPIFHGTEGVVSRFRVLRAPGLIFGGTEGVGSLFHVFRSRKYFQPY